MAGSGKASVAAINAADRTVRQAVDAFLAQPRAATTHRTYTRTLDHLARTLGPDRPLADLATDE